MSDQPPLDPHDLFGIESNLKEENPRTPERSSRPVSSFGPVPLFSPPLVKHEGGADELPVTTNKLDDPNLLAGMSTEELDLLYNAVDPFATSPAKASAAAVNPNGSNVSAYNPRSLSSVDLDIRQDVQRQLSSPRWKNWRIVPSGIVSVHHSNLNETEPESLSHVEHEAIVGQGGLVSALCPVWKKRTAQTRQKESPTSSFRRVAEYACLCVNCPYRLQVMRIPGGLVVLEKQQSVNGILSPVSHDQRAHDHIPSSSKGSSGGSKSTLSHTQKEFIVKHGQLNGNRDLFLDSMIANPNVPCSDQQIESPNKFKHVVFDYMRRNAKYLQSSQGLCMTLDIMLEILELLRTSPQDRSNVAPTGNSDHLYYNRPGWKQVWKYIVLVDHDFSAVSGHFTSILLEPIDVVARSKAAGDMFPDNHVQLEGDYFSMNKVDASWEVGHVGVSDYKHSYWPVVYQIAKGNEQRICEFVPSLAVVCGDCH